MANLTVRAKGVIFAHERGYRVVGGSVISPKGKERKTTPRNGYPSFNVYVGGGKRVEVPVHRLVGYVKYGPSAFTEGELRHADNNPNNFDPSNIILGTHSQNMMDMPPDVRSGKAKRASSFIRKFSNNEVDEIRADRERGLTYKELMEKYEITSKGTMSHIINNDYVTDKLSAA